MRKLSIFDKVFLGFDNSFGRMQFWTCLISARASFEFCTFLKTVHRFSVLVFLIHQANCRVKGPKLELKFYLNSWTTSIYECCKSLHSKRYIYSTCSIDLHIYIYIYTHTCSYMYMWLLHVFKWKFYKMVHLEAQFELYLMIVKCFWNAKQKLNWCIFNQMSVCLH